MLVQRMRSLAANGADESAAATGSSSLRVMTYNVLAQCYIKSSFFPYCQPSVLRWKNRSKQLAAVFQALPVQPHVICLQEVDQYNEFWAEMMASIGYHGLYAQKTSGKRDGVAIFWKHAELELVEHETRSLDDPVGDESHCSDDLLARTQRGSVALLAHLKQKPEASRALPQAFVVATTHLFWDPSQEDVKLLQMQRLLRPLEAFAQRLALPLVFAGDFNSLPQSRVYDLITRTHGFASAYAQYRAPRGEPDFTNVNGSAPSKGDGSPVAAFVGTLDYIFYHPHATSGSMEPVALLELMALEDAMKSVALPSPASPSDHLPLLCEFRM